MARCTDSTYETELECEQASKTWCEDSINWMMEPDPLGKFVTCLDLSGVTDSVALVVEVGVTVAILFTGFVLTRRIVRAMREA